MSSRVFQSIVLQMKECTDRVIGVIDDQGTVVSCNQLTWIGEKWEGAASALNVNESAVVIYGDKTFKPLVSRGSHFDYAAFVQGSDEQAKLICSMVTVALNSAKSLLRGEARQDRLRQEHHLRQHPAGRHLRPRQGAALCLRGPAGRVPGAPGGLGRDRRSGRGAESVLRQARRLRHLHQRDGYRRHQDPDRRGRRQRTSTASPRASRMPWPENLKLKTIIGIGTVVSHIRDLARRLQGGRQMAIEVGKVFDTEKYHHQL